MRKNALVEYLQSKGIVFRQKGLENIATCIFCEKKDHMYVNSESNIFHCFVCGEKGNFWKAVKHFGDMNIYQYQPKGKEKKKLPKPENVEKFKKALIKDTEAMNYLKNVRGFTDETINKFQLGLNQEYITIPYFKNEVCVNFKFRSLKERVFQKEAQCESTLFNIDSLDKSKPLIIVEGEYDCISAVQLGFKNVVSVPNGSSSFDTEWLDSFDNFTDIFLVYDNDESGEKGAQTAALKIEGICKRVLLPLKDFNDCLMGGYDFDSLQQYFNTAKEYKPESVVPICNVIQEIEEIFFNGEMTRGLQIKEWSNFMDKIGGIRPCETTIITGDTGTGKTTWTLNLFYNLILLDHPVFIISSEMPNRIIVRKLFSIYVGKSFYDFVEEDFKKAVEFYCRKNIFFANSFDFDIEKISILIKYVDRRFDVKHTMIDHLHHFIKCRNEDKVHQTEKFMQKLKNVVMQTKTHAFVIAHPAKLKNNKGFVDMNDLKGSSAIKQDADNVISVWREKDADSKKKKKDESNNLEVNLQKVRDDAGHEGIVDFSFNTDSQTYYEPVT